MFSTKLKTYATISKGDINLNFKDMYNLAPDKLKFWLTASTQVG